MDSSEANSLPVPTEGPPSAKRIKQQEGFTSVPTPPTAPAPKIETFSKSPLTSDLKKCSFEEYLNDKGLGPLATVQAPPKSHHAVRPDMEGFFDLSEKAITRVERCAAFQPGRQIDTTWIAPLRFAIYLQLMIVVKFWAYTYESSTQPPRPNLLPLPMDVAYAIGALRPLKTKDFMDIYLDPEYILKQIKKKMPTFRMDNFAMKAEYDAILSSVIHKHKAFMPVNMEFHTSLLDTLVISDPRVPQYACLSGPALPEHTALFAYQLRLWTGKKLHNIYIPNLSPFNTHMLCRLTRSAATLYMDWETCFNDTMCLLRTYGKGLPN
jgi:hypothetical protein